MGVRKSDPVEGYFPVWSYEIGDQYRLYIILNNENLTL